MKVLCVLALMGLGLLALVSSGCGGGDSEEGPRLNVAEITLLGQIEVTGLTGGSSFWGGGDNAVVFTPDSRFLIAQTETELQIFPIAAIADTTTPAATIPAGSFEFTPDDRWLVVTREGSREFLR